MQKVILFLLICFFALSLIGQTKEIIYEESFDDFLNPDRGFYSPTYGIASDFSPLTIDWLLDIKNEPFTPWQANYSVKTSLVLRHYVLDLFVESDSISISFLNKIQNDFEIARQTGIRLILRFSYTITPPTGNCGSWICPPYGDATKSRILTHIAQLKPLLFDYEDVISVFQHGFIGVWGENYYTDHFGDASLQGQGKLNDQNWQDRIDVLKALLDAVPKSRMVQIRYPQLKQKYIYGIDAPVTVRPMTLSQAYLETDISRIGFHNDCFLSSIDDSGTYWNYGTSIEPVSNQTEILKPYVSHDGQFTAVGGETCSDIAYDPQNNCDDHAGMAIAEMKQLHYSYLNCEYNNEVNNDWETEGCMDEIKRRLGYRFVLRKAYFLETVSSGQNFQFTLDLENIGFTSPYNLRNLYLILRNVESKIEYDFQLNSKNSDSRFWFPDSIITIDDFFVLPSEFRPGKYSLFLQIRDELNGGTMNKSPDYSIRFANKDMWESNSGYNNLNHTVEVSETTTSNNHFTTPLSFLIKPNPSNNLVTIQYNLDKASKIEFEILDLKGHQVFVLNETHKLAGKHEETIDISKISPGAYIVIFKTEMGNGREILIKAF